jgi:dipeptidyl-peptidase-4
VKALSARSFVDPGRIGIFGTSYGGYLAALALVRYPDLFAAASASSPVTDWRLYDTIYTERYMGLPEVNADGYERARVMRYADRMRGRLLIYYGTADNNVHPSNALQLIQALSLARKSVEVQVGPDAEHSSVNVDRMMEFFIEQLVVHPDRLRTVTP